MDGKYARPENDHGTHVAGILAGDWRRTESDGLLEEDLIGVCPDLRLYDLRVLKQILCSTATDLGRERFQGAGTLDVLRALQSV